MIDGYKKLIGGLGWKREIPKDDAATLQTVRVAQVAAIFQGLARDVERPAIQIVQTLEFLRTTP